jgi:hypothetical protein
MGHIYSFNPLLSHWTEIVTNGIGKVVCIFVGWYQEPLPEIDLQPSDHY